MRVVLDKVGSVLERCIFGKYCYLVRKRSYDGPVRTNRPDVHRKLPCIRIRILKIICIFRNNRYICT